MEESVLEMTNSDAFYFVLDFFITVLARMSRGLLPRREDFNNSAFVAFLDLGLPGHQPDQGTSEHRFNNLILNNTILDIKAGHL